MPVIRGSMRDVARATTWWVRLWTAMAALPGRSSAPSAVAGLRALRVCLPVLPHLPVVGRGDGLAARADSPGRPVARGGTADRGGGRDFDLCLGCMACVTACPSEAGQHDEISIEAAREWTEVAANAEDSAADASSALSAGGSAAGGSAEVAGGLGPAGARTRRFGARGAPVGCATGSTREAIFALFRYPCSAAGRDGAAARR